MFPCVTRAVAGGAALHRGGRHQNQSKIRLNLESSGISPLMTSGTYRQPSCPSLALGTLPWSRQAAPAPPGSEPGDGAACSSDRRQRDGAGLGARPGRRGDGAPRPAVSPALCLEQRSREVGRPGDPGISAYTTGLMWGPEKGPPRPGSPRGWGESWVTCKQGRGLLRGSGWGC